MALLTFKREKIFKILFSTQILICQLEIPLDATIEALKMFKGLSILNAAPAVANLPDIAYKLPNIFCVNELEAEELTKISFNKVEDAKKIIQSLTRERGCKIVIVTLGKHGAAFNDADKIYHVPVPCKSTRVVDTTGMKSEIKQIQL
jgi:ribokinase